MLSLFENNKHLSEISVYFLTSGISMENENFLKQIAESYGREFMFINIKDILEKDIREKGHRTQKSGGIDTYSWIFTVKFLPESINRCLYLDCDTLVTSTIDELIYIDISSFAFTAVLDKISSQYKKWVGLKKGEQYFNSGVLLMNLDYWRKKSILDELLLAEPVKNGWFSDQELINCFFRGKIKTLSLRYNALTFIEVYSPFALKFLSDGCFYEKKEINEASQNPAIIHYCFSFLCRPWHLNCELKSARKWEYYFQKTKWSSFYKKKKYKLAKQWILMKLLYRIPLIGKMLFVVYEFSLECFKIFLYKHGVIRK
jgi:lipopolysaccharide biosynthesis glycosyltransferase